jgi:hypothetical protein
MNRLVLMILCCRNDKTITNRGGGMAVAEGFPHPCNWVYLKMPGTGIENEARITVIYSLVPFLTLDCILTARMITKYSEYLARARSFFCKTLNNFWHPRWRQWIHGVKAWLYCEKIDEQK